MSMKEDRKKRDRKDENYVQIPFSANGGVRSLKQGLRLGEDYGSDSEELVLTSGESQT